MIRAFMCNSHPPDQATASQLLTYNRGHGGVENLLPYRRDVTFDEDRSTIRKGHGPQKLAAFRNLAIALLSQVVRSLKKKIDFPVILRHYARSWRSVFTLLGLECGL